MTPNQKTSAICYLPPVRRRPATSISLFLAVALCLVAGVRVPGQDSTTPVQTNDTTQVDQTTSNDASQDAAADDQLASTNSVSDTNQVISAGPDGRTRRLQRRPPRVRSSSSTSDLANNSSSTNATSSLDYAAFRLVADRNIFDPNRAPRTVRASSAPKTTDSFTLVGTMSYEKGVFAFFDGTSPDYKKVLKPHDSIAGYQVASITPDSIKLARDTNMMELRVGTQMRRRDDGSWEMLAASGSYAAASTTSSSNDAASTGAESDVLRKLRERREKE